MAYYDYIKSGHDKQCLENFEKLKETIVVGEYSKAYEHICNLENKMREQDEKIK
jgi:hypothetical protein